MDMNKVVRVWPPAGSFWTLRRVILAAIALAVVVVSANSFVVIQPGYSGVIFNIWTGALRTVDQGMAIRLPFVSKVQSYPVALRTYTMVMRSGEGAYAGDDSIDLPTREGQHIRQDISVTYNTSAEQAAQVFRAFRGADIEDIESSFIRRTFITVAQNVAGQMSLSEIISAKRGALQDEIQRSLEIELSKMGFHLDKVNLGASHLPQAIEIQMQQKMAAQQDAQKAEYELQKQETLAKAAVAQAQGEAQARLVKVKAESEGNRELSLSLTPSLVQYRAIEKWNGTLPQVTSGATPFIDLRGKLAE